MATWSDQAVFYHLYPLGLCGAPQHNDFNQAPQPRLLGLIPWLEHARQLGASAIYLGPVLESSGHGYDVADYFQMDRRLGDNETLARVVEEAHQRGLKVVLEGVFHHVGRHFWAFRDVLQNGSGSPFASWFHLDFNGRSPYGDSFSYQGWNGCLDLVKLNLGHPEVKGHLLEAAATWIRDFHIDGLRLDAADCLDTGFMAELSAHCHRMRPDFWILGEVLHGDHYQRLLVDGGLDSVTNYECYKGLFSSHREQNYFEIAHSLRRQFADYGLFRGRNLYSFADNHDVSRVASQLNDQSHLYPLYCLLFTMPGIPSIYYGSEFGIFGEKQAGGDWNLRPALDLGQLRASSPQPNLPPALARLAKLRTSLPALARGDYQQLALSNQRLVFSRRCPEQWLVVAVSAEKNPISEEIKLPQAVKGKLVDLLNPGQEFGLDDGRARIDPLWPCWARVMEVREG